MLNDSRSWCRQSRVLWRDSNFYGHPGESTGITDEAAGHGNCLPDVARDRDRNQIEAAEAAVCRVESDPSGSRHKDLRPCMGRSRIARPDASLVGIVKITGDNPGSESEHACSFNEQHREIPARPPATV